MGKPVARGTAGWKPVWVAGYPSAKLSAAEYTGFQYRFIHRTARQGVSGS